MGSSDYISNLRTFVRDGERPDRPNDRDRYLDSVAYWRDAYEKSQQVEGELRARILKLERTLEASIGATVGRTKANTGSQRKRQRGGATGGEDADGRATKLAKTTANSIGPRAATLPPAVLDNDLGITEDTDVNNLLRHIYGVQEAMIGISSSKVTAKELTHLVLQSAADIRRVISSLQTHAVLDAASQSKARNFTTRTQEQRAAPVHTELISDTNIKCTAVAGLFPALLRALGSLDDLSNVQTYQGELIHSFISIFRELLERICALSASNCRRKAVGAAANKGASKRKGRLLAEISDFLPEPTLSEPTSSEEDNKVIRELCQLAFAMMDSLDPNISTENEVFEGFLFFIITRVGDSLKSFVFGSESPVMSMDPQVEERESSQEAQAPYLIDLLKHAITVTAKQFGLDTPFRQACHSISPSWEKNRDNHSILTKPRLRLQNTLLKAVFGEQAEEFAESLKKPLETSVDPCLDFTVNKTDRKENNTAEWFKNEVWETVGWDVLRGMIAWK